MNINDQKQISKLKSLVNTSAGQLLIEYLKHRYDIIINEKIDKSQSVDKIAFDYLIRDEKADEIKSIIEFLTS